jgi:hypothetical protein
MFVNAVLFVLNVMFAIEHAKKGRSWVAAANAFAAGFILAATLALILF